MKRDLPGWLNIPAAAAFVGMSRRTIDTAIDAGTIKIGFWYESPSGVRGLLKRTDLERFRRRRAEAQRLTDKARLLRG